MPPKKNVPAPAALTHLFLARTFYTYAYGTDTECIHGIFPTTRLAEIAMQRAFKEAVVDQSMSIDGEEYGVDGSVKLQADAGEGDGLMGTVTLIAMAPEMMACIKEGSTKVVGEAKPGRKRRRRENNEAEEEEKDDELEALRAIRGEWDDSDEGY